MKSVWFNGPYDLWTKNDVVLLITICWPLMNNVEVEQIFSSGGIPTADLLSGKHWWRPLYHGSLQLTLISTTFDCQKSSKFILGYRKENNFRKSLVEKEIGLKIVNRIVEYQFRIFFLWATPTIFESKKIYCFLCHWNDNMKPANCKKMFTFERVNWDDRIVNHFTVETLYLAIYI